MGPQDNVKQSLEEWAQSLSVDIGSTIDTILKATDELRNFSTSLSTTFGNTRTRIAEINQAVADTIPRIERLGGTQQQALETLREVAEATRKNVLATGDEAAKLFAVGGLIGESTREIVESFTNVGINFTQVGGQLEDSILYVNSVGLNVEAVMKNVVNQSDKLNRFNFEGGVQGLTKMAAQASMLRFDMNQTFQLADKVLDPDKAIEVASAFQRMGVSAGNLVDPFQLMNQSINDPQGLQNSLADVAKQFTYFDEKTKTFKINPAGVLKLREIEAQTGVSAKEMSKLGLAAREVDEILSQIDPSINLPEEDKMYLANIAKMGQGGEYEVMIDGESKKISEVSNEKLTELIKQQKEAPKSAEDLARNSLNVSQLIQADVNAIKSAIVLGPASQQTLVKEEEGIYKAVSSITGGLSKEFADSKLTRDILTKTMREAGGFYDQLKGGASFGDAVKNLGDRLGIVNKETQDLLAEKMRLALSDAGEKLTDKTIAERITKKYGIEPSQKMLGVPKGKSTYSKADVNLNGNYTFQIKSEDSVTQQQLTSLINSTSFKQEIIKIIEKYFKDKGRIDKE